MTEEYDTGDAILRVENIEKHFGGITAVDGASFELEKGKITGLIGPNGAGKTTTFNMLSGFYKPDKGRVLFKGQPLESLMEPSSEERLIWSAAAAGTFGIAGVGIVAQFSTGPVPLAIGAIAGGGIGVGTYFGQQLVRERREEHRPSRPFQLATHGLSRTFQITRELENMTVLENLMLGAKNQDGESLRNVWLRPSAVKAEEEKVIERAHEVLELLELSHLTHEYGSNLSGGQRKLLELGRVLMTDPDLVLLDEPVAGVNPSLRNNLLERIESLRDEGYSFCIIEHDMEVIMNVSDKVIVMNQGDILVEGPPEIIREDERVIEAYLGGV